jgi:hypothetical protein
MGFVGVGLIGRRFVAVRELPFGPQLARNIAFGIFFAPVGRPAEPTRGELVGLGLTTRARSLRAVSDL